MALAPDLSTGSGLGMVANPRQGGLSGMARGSILRGWWRWRLGLGFRPTLNFIARILVPGRLWEPQARAFTRAERLPLSASLSPWGKQHDKAKTELALEPG